jgi:hypothetical protein
MAEKTDLVSQIMQAFQPQEASVLKLQAMSKATARESMDERDMEALTEKFQPDWYYKQVQGPEEFRLRKLALNYVQAGEIQLPTNGGQDWFTCCVAECEKGLKDYPSSPYLQYLLARALTGLGNLKQARMVLDPLIRQHPDFVDALLQRGKVLDEAGDEEGCKVDYAFARKLDPAIKLPPPFTESVLNLWVKAPGINAATPVFRLRRGRRPYCIWCGDVQEKGLHENGCPVEYGLKKQAKTGGGIFSLVGPSEDLGYRMNIARLELQSSKWFDSEGQPRFGPQDYGVRSRLLYETERFTLQRLGKLTSTQIISACARDEAKYFDSHFDWIRQIVSLETESGLKKGYSELGRIRIQNQL